MNEYNGFNQLTQVLSDSDTISYTYKPDGMRLSKSVSGVEITHVWDGSNIVMDLESNNGVANLKDRYIRGHSLIKSDLSGNYIFNAHGDVVQLTNEANGSIMKVYDYDAFWGTT